MAVVASMNSMELPTGTPNGTLLHCPYRFSYMRRGKGKPEGMNEGGLPDISSHGSTGSLTAAATTTTATTTTTAATTTTTPATYASTAGSAPVAPAAATTNDNGAANAIHPYENSIKTISTVSTVEEFWQIYNYLKRPNDLPTTTDYHFFRGGIKPTWEDTCNARGGKWIVRLPKGLASRYWEEVILALIGGQFPGIQDGEICGAVVSIRYSEDILGIWNRTASDRDVVERLRDAIKRVLQLPAHAPMEYKPHQTAMQDKSSFRNTQVWKPKSAEGRSDSRGESRRSGSWGDREERKKSRDLERSWR